MIYNLDFLIAAMIFLAVILFQFKYQKRMPTINSRIFLFCIYLAFADVALDICSSMLMEHERASQYAVQIGFLLTLFYLVQISIPCILFLYTQSLYQNLAVLKTARIISWILPWIIFSVLVIMNVWTGYFFYFDLNGNYQRGIYYYTSYIYALFYGVLIALVSVYQKEKLEKRKRTVVWEFLIVLSSCVLLQMVCSSMLVTGFGIAIGIFLMYLSLNNPSDQLDNLTGTFDIQCFHQWSQGLMEWNKSFHVLSVDICQLKRINMIFGASNGDEVLKIAACKLQHIDESIYVFRVTGNRFLMVMESIQVYEKAKEEIRRIFSEPMMIRGEAVQSSAVVCGVIEAKELKNGDDLLTYIEYLVSAAPGVDDYVMIQGNDSTMEGFKYQQEVEQFLNTAIEEDLFEVYYQPVYSLEVNTYVTLEALSRLRHPTLGMISPDIFIGIAEQSGQISKIGYLQFCKILKFLDENRDMMNSLKNVKFNLSPAELLKPENIAALLQAIEDWNIPPSWIQFEITETVATEYIDQLYQSIEVIRKAGINICLDDFGSGYANLNTVLKLPFSAIKLDRSLLSGILEDAKIAEFYRQMVKILHNMDFKIISEGVECKEEADLLKSWSVDMIQGFYYSRPLQGDEIKRLIM